MPSNLVKENINNMRIVYAEIKDTKGNVREERVNEIILERLTDKTKEPYGENVEFRVKVKPVIYEQQPKKIDSVTGFTLEKEAVKKAPLIKDLDIKFQEIQKELNKVQKKNQNESIEIQANIVTIQKIETIKLEDGNEKQEITEYFEIPNREIQNIDIL